MESVGLRGKVLSTFTTLALAFSSFGARISFRPSNTPGDCTTSILRFTLASEQLELCSPTSLPAYSSEDDLTIPGVGYAGLEQQAGYGILSARAASPGASPAPDFPDFSTSVADYREELLELQARIPGRTLTPGPSADLWGESVAGVQIDFTLTIAEDQLSMRTVEWFAGHNDRLWIFTLTWDTSQANAAEWEQASTHFSVWTPTGTGLPATAFDLGAASLTPSGPEGRGATGGVVDVGLPSWWEGDVCDATNYAEATGLDAIPLGSPWHGVYACGTNPISAMIDHGVLFFEGDEVGALEFECVELALRFFYLEWAIPPWHGNGNTLKNFPPDHVDSLIFYENGTHPLIPGDLLTEEASTNNPYGHVMVVIDVSGLNASGTGSITVMEQNASLAGRHSIAMSNWTATDSWTGFPVQGWIHAKANTYEILNGAVNALGLQSTGKYIAAGEFTGYGATPAYHIIRFNSNSSLDTNFNPGGSGFSGFTTAQIYALKVLSNDKILVGGFFDVYNSTTVTNLVQLNSDGTLDATFNPPDAYGASGDPSIRAIAVQPDGKILIGGNFTSLDSVTHNYIARLNADGTPDVTFTGSVTGTVYSLVVQPDGKILVGGTLTGSNRRGLTRLMSDGSLDATFNPSGVGVNTGKSVTSIALQGDKILIGGDFTKYNGVNRSMVARLLSDGTLDTTFDPGTGVTGTNANLKAVVPQADGRILIAGKFAAYNGTTRYNITRLSYFGALDTSFIPSGDFAAIDDIDENKIINALLLQPDGNIRIGGNFWEYIARIPNQIKSCYTLTTGASPSEGGTVTVSSAPNCPVGSDMKYISGSYTLTAIRNVGQDYFFLNWSTGSTTNPLTINLTSNRTITANFLQAPALFTKISPQNGTSVLYKPVILSWNTSERATSYEYCLVATASACPCDDDNHSTWTSVGTNTSVFLATLSPGTTYCWNARARNAVDTTHAYSSWSFTTLPAGNSIYLPLLIR